MLNYLAPKGSVSKNWIDFEKLVSIFESEHRANIELCPSTFSNLQVNRYTKRRESKILFPLGKDRYSILWVTVIQDIESHIFKLSKTATILYCWLFPLSSILSILFQLRHYWTDGYVLKVRGNIITTWLMAKLVEKQVSVVPSCSENSLSWKICYL